MSPCTRLPGDGAAAGDDDVLQPERLAPDQVPGSVRDRKGLHRLVVACAVAVFSWSVAELLLSPGPKLRVSPLDSLASPAAFAPPAGLVADSAMYCGVGMYLHVALAGDEHGLPRAGDQRLRPALLRREGRNRGARRR